MKPRELPRVVAHSTTPIRTETLRKKGIEEIRVLSESRFLHIVRKLVEDAVTRRLADLLPLTADATEETEVIVLEESLDALKKASDATLGAEARPIAKASTKEPAKPAAAAPASEASSNPYREKWDDLRRKHVEAIEAIEARLNSLGTAVRGMETKLGPRAEPAGDAGRERRKGPRESGVRAAKEEESRGTD